MASSNVIALAASLGSVNFIYLLWVIWCRIRPSKAKNKVVIITGASSGIGEGKLNYNAHSSKDTLAMYTNMLRKSSAIH